MCAKAALETWANRILIKHDPIEWTEKKLRHKQQGSFLAKWEEIFTNAALLDQRPWDRTKGTPWALDQLNEMRTLLEHYKPHLQPYSMKRDPLPALAEVQTLLQAARKLRQDTERFT